MGTTPAPPTDAAGLAAAEAEEARYYSSATKRSKHRREEFSKDVVHYGTVGIIIIAALCVTSGLIAWTCHQILPTERLWLDDNHINNLTESGKLLLSGTVGALGSKFLTKNLES